jgi:hypothetical protein
MYEKKTSKNKETHKEMQMKQKMMTINKTKQKYV